MNKDRNCDQVEAEIFELFRGIKMTASPERLSLEEALGRAIAEGKSLRQWQASGRPLGSVRLFLRRNGGLLPAGKFRFIRFPFLRLFRNRVNTAGRIAPQLEIWNCSENDQPVFPLSRISWQDVPETGRLRIDERLRDDLRLNLEIWRSEQNVYIQLGVKDTRPKLGVIREFIGKARNAYIETVWRWQNGIRLGVAEWGLPLVLIVLTLVLAPSAMRSYKDPGQRLDDSYSQTHVEPDENQVLGQKCFKHLCGDPKYLSDTDTVNGV